MEEIEGCFPLGKKMKGLFKNKPKTPGELVISTRELLKYTEKSSEVRERKREEKVKFADGFCIVN